MARQGTTTVAGAGESHERMTPLRIVREAQGRTQRSVAEEAGITPEQLSRAERGMGALSINTLYRLARVLRLDELSNQLRPYVDDATLREFP